VAVQEARRAAPRAAPTFSCVKATSWPGPFSECIVSFHHIGHHVWVVASAPMPLSHTSNLRGSYVRK
jgi:hypothetical protein